jgi:hypothetical protein
VRHTQINKDTTNICSHSLLPNSATYTDQQGHYQYMQPQSAHQQCDIHRSARTLPVHAATICSRTVRHTQINKDTTSTCSHSLLTNSAAYTDQQGHYQYMQPQSAHEQCGIYRSTRTLPIYAVTICSRTVRHIQINKDTTNI